MITQHREIASYQSSVNKPRNSLKTELAKYRKEMWCVNLGQQPCTHPTAHLLPSSTEQGTKKMEKLTGQDKDRETVPSWAKGDLTSVKLQ